MAPESHAGSSYAVGNLRSNQLPDRPATHFEGLVTRMASLTGDARTIDAILDEMHERAFGPLPPEKNVSGVREARSGRLGDAQDRMDDIEAVLGRIRAKVEQLAAFV